MIAYRLHFEKANLEAAQIVRSGRLGTPRYFDSQFSMQVKAGNIRTQDELGGGPLYDIGIYCINAARYLLGAEPLEVFAAATRSGDRRFREVHETVTGLMRFPREVIASFTCSFGASDRARYEVVGAKGRIALDPAYEYAEGLTYELEIGGKSRRKNFAKSDQFAPELIHFARCVRQGRAPEPSGKEGLIDVRIIEAMQRSISTGRWVSLSLAPHERKKRRPSLRQEIRRPAVPRAPKLVNAESAHS
jgi:glucose-fructose oxidoreductase